MKNPRTSQLIGIELEIYSKLDISRLNNKIKSMGIYGFEVVNDASLYDYIDEGGYRFYGAEIRCNAPFIINEIENKIRDLHKIVNDPEVSARFNDDDSIRGTTGLHIHFGLDHGRKYSILDFIRLLDNIYADENEIEDLAMRPCNRWARSMGDIVYQVENSISRLRQYRETKSNNEVDIPLVDKINHISTDRRRIHSIMINTVNYSEEYGQYKNSFKYLKSFYNSLFNNALIADLVSNYISDGNDSILSASIYQDYTVEVVPTEVETTDTFYISDIAQQYNSLMRFKSRNGKLYLNKYINHHEQIDAIFRYIADYFNFSQSHLGFSANYDMKKIRMVYDINNGYINRCIDTVRDDSHPMFNAFRDQVSQLYTTLFSMNLDTSIINLKLNWFCDMYGYHYDDNRYYGVNATNIGTTHQDGSNKLNTIEFRWASAKLISNISATMTYFWKLADIYFKSMTGECEMQWNNVSLRDITDFSKSIRGPFAHTISVIDENKLIGRVKISTLSSIVTNPYKSSMINVMAHHDRNQIENICLEQIESRNNRKEIMKQHLKSITEDKKYELICKFRTGDFDFSQ